MTLGQQDQQDARDEGREWEQEVDDAQQIADGDRADRHGAAGVHDHADAERALADGASAPEPFEHDEVDDLREVEQQDEQCGGPAAGHAVQAEDAGEDDGGEQEHAVDDQAVERDRGGARADTRQLEPQLDVFRGFDLVLLPQPFGRPLRPSRGSAHFLILPPTW